MSDAYKKCPICGKSFLPREEEMYCSSLCKMEANRRTQREQYVPETERECPICGKVFPVWGTKKYCSDECRKKDSRRREKEFRRQDGKTRETERKCPVCGKVFTAKSCKKYCSEECHKEAQRKRYQMKRDTADGKALQEKWQQRWQNHFQRVGFSRAFLSRYGKSESMIQIVNIMRQCKAAGYGNNYGRFVAEGLAKTDKLEFITEEEE